MSLWTSRRPWVRPASSPCRQGLVALLVLTAAATGEAVATAQSEEVPLRALVTQMVSLRYRSASDALTQVEGLLSERGTVELQPHGNALVVRDEMAAVRRVLARLRQYDQPPRRVRLEIQIVRAGAAASGDAPTGEQLPAELVRRLRELLRFESFALLAEAGLEMMEGERVAYRFGSDYRVAFELGVLSSAGQLRLQDFVVSRGPDEDDRPLLHTHLNLTLDRPMVLGLAQTEGSDRALMVVLTSRLLEEAAR